MCLPLTPSFLKKNPAHNPNHRRYADNTTQKRVVRGAPLYSRAALRTVLRTLDPIPRVHESETISLNLIHSVALGLVGALDVDLYMPSTGGQLVWINRS